MKQQIRQETKWTKCPRFLLHENDGVFGQYHQRRPLGEQGPRHRCHLDLWLTEVMGIEGIPNPLHDWFVASPPQPAFMSDTIGRSSDEFPFWL